jgi:hypothetical protein
MTTDTPKPATVLDGQLDRAIDPEYAAVSPLAVAGLVLSIAGLGAFLAVPLIAAPVAGVMLSLLALRKIRRSEGVLTGRRIAKVGLIVGSILAVLAAGFHGEAWREDRDTLAAIKAQAYDAFDEILAGRYAEVYARMPEGYRLRQATGPEAFAARIAPHFRDAGALEGRRLLSLKQVYSSEGHLLAPAIMEAEFANRTYQFTLWFMRTDPQTWALVSVEGGETIQSMLKHPNVVPLEPVTGPIQQKHEHEH